MTPIYNLKGAQCLPVERNTPDIDSDGFNEAISELKKVGVEVNNIKLSKILIPIIQKEWKGGSGDPAVLFSKTMSALSSSIDKWLSLVKEDK